MSPLKVYLSPTGTHSRAMTRIANALTQHAPAGVKPVRRQSDADLVLLHVINQDAIPYAQSLTARGQKYAVVQCCLQTAGLSQESDWHEFWRQSVVVWSYYYLADYARTEHATNYYHAPLGIDPVFHQHTPLGSLHRLLRGTVLTTGYVTGPGAEAIQEVWQAADRLGLNCVHIGPSSVSGMTYKPFHWQSYKDISDEALSTLLRRVSWVASLRHVEGFELPAAEGLACGARPVLFDQSDLRCWYGEHAEYVPECAGEELVGRLIEVFNRAPRPVTESERQSVMQRFDWRRIAEGFWKMIMERI